MTDDERITVTETLVVHADRTEAFDAWIVDFMRGVGEQPGHDGPVIRLDQAGGIVHLLHRFADRPSFDTWHRSDQRRALLTAVEGLAIHRQQLRAGRRPRFGLPSEASAPKWKRVLVSWATVFPLLLATSYAAQALVSNWPRPLTLAVSSLLITLMLNLLIFPRLNRRLDPWLLEDEDGQVRKPPA